VIGMPWTKGVSITPLAEPDKPAYLSGIIADALDKGAEVINLEAGDDRAAGSLLRPVILYPVNDRMAVYHEEQFGPVIPVVPFTDIATPIESITQSRFGQQVSLFGQDKELIGELIDMLSMQVGRININTQSQRSPDNFVFGGRKDSAEGSLSVDEALLTFSTHSVVAARQDEANKKIFEDILMDNQSSRLSNNCVSCG
jgi:glyceraldehyde-3-phosphate dehydrogenase (NADP+)